MFKIEAESVFFMINNRFCFKITVLYCGHNLAIGIINSTRVLSNCGMQQMVEQIINLKQEKRKYTAYFLSANYPLIKKFAIDAN